MNSLKIGIIGIIILLPFLFLSMVEARRFVLEEKAETVTEQVISHAMRDGVFALKTYSYFSHGEEGREIVIAEEEVKQVMMDSFAFGLNAKTLSERERVTRNIRIIGFVAYDRLILLDIAKRERLVIPYFKVEKQGERLFYSKQTLREDKGKDITEREIKVGRLLEQVLAPFMQDSGLQIPEHTASLVGRDFSEVGVFMIVQGDPLKIGQEKSYIKMGKVSLSERKE